jgi:hypothetical protein
MKAKRKERERQTEKYIGNDDDSYIKTLVTASLDISSPGSNSFQTLPIVFFCCIYPTPTFT